MIGISRAVSDAKRFEVTDVSLAEKSETTEAEINLVEGKIETNLTFHKVNDYAVYKITFKNNDNKEFFIRSITNDNTNPYVTYSYEQEQDDNVKSGDTVDILLKLTYNNEVKDLNKRDVQETVKFNFDMQDEEGNMVLSDEKVNSRLSVNVLEYAILTLAILIALVFIFFKSKKARKAAIACLVLLTPFIVKAVDSSFEIVITTNVKLHDKMAMVVEVNGKQEVIAVPYGEAPKVELPEPEKEGYDFVGWFEEDKKSEYDFEKEVAEDISIKAKYKPIDYTISYDYDGGEAKNPVTYNIETNSITLTNPTKEGYSFSGWTGSNGKTYQTRVTIDKGSIGNLTFTANFSAKEDTKYTVVHKYKNLEGDGYSEEFTEELTGTTGTVVKPSTRTVTGFVNPSLKNLTIAGDGSSKLEYIYERKMVTLAYSEDVISNKPAGSYKYGTPITINAKDKVGYTFKEWSYNAVFIPAFIDADNNNAISAGDIVIIGTDWFFVIAPPENSQVKLITRLGIDTNGNQSETANQYTFSSMIQMKYYWEENPNDYSPFGDSSHPYVYRTTINRDSIAGDPNVTGAGINQIVNHYKDNLDNLGIISIVDARLMSYEEAEALGCSNADKSCPEFISNYSSTWLGSVGGTNPQYMWYIWRKLALASLTMNRYSIRPVIVVNEKDISTLNKVNSLSTFNLEDDTNITAIYNPNKNTPYTVIHKMQDQDDESVYNIVESIEGTGFTGDLIRPIVNTSYYHYGDYILPYTQTVEIAADGSTVVEYVYQYKYYNITLDPSGGYVNTESIKVEKGSSISVSNPKLSNYIFKGWYTEAEGGTLVVEPSKSFTPTRTQTLYAHWEFDASPKGFLIDYDDNNAVSIGDAVRIGSDDFYYIGRDENNNLKLLSKYNLESGDNRQKGKNSNTVESRWFFSRTNYWQDESLGYTFTTEGDGSLSYVYRTSENQAVPENSINIVNYVYYLRDSLGVDVIDARLMSYSEAIAAGCGTSSRCPSFMNPPFNNSSPYYWLGTVDSSSGKVAVIYYNDAINQSFLRFIDYNVNYTAVRPVIVVPERQISMPWDSNKMAHLVDINNDSDYSIGDKIIIGEEEFYIVGRNFNKHELNILPKYNISYHYGNYVQSSDSSDVTFSSFPYWSREYTPNIDNYQYTTDDSGYYYMYRDKYGKAVPENNLTNYIENYVDYLQSTYLIHIKDAKLMSYSEAVNLGCSFDEENTCPEYMTNQSFWLGSIDYDPDSSDNLDEVVFYIDEYNNCIWINVYDSGAGIRPMLTISENDVEMSWGNTNRAGTEVTIGNDEFYIIGQDVNGNYKLITKYNLDANYRQSESNSVGTIFATTNYWSTGGTSSSSASSNNDCIDAYCDGFSGYRYIYRDKDNKDVPENIVKNYVNNYANYLKTTYNLGVIDARLMSYREANLLGCSNIPASCPDYIGTNPPYWIGNLRSSISIWAIYEKWNCYGTAACSGSPNNYAGGNLSADYFEYGVGGSQSEIENGIRPVIIVPASAVPN